MNHITLGPPDHAGYRRLIFVAERQLGFGMHRASNSAQRFSDLVLVLYRKYMDQADADARSSATAAERSWLQSRLDLQRREGSPCVDIYHHTRPAERRLPLIPALTEVAITPVGYVCPELRLYSAYVFTDDPQFVLVGVERTLRGLQTWRQLTQSLGTLMAIETKRSLGSWCEWVGVIIVAGLGLVVVAKSKLLRASGAIARARKGALEFHEYRSLCGLLEHLRTVNLSGRHIKHGLYRPHVDQTRESASPNSLIHCDELMARELSRWERLLLRSNGVSCKRALFRRGLEPPPSLHADATSNACYADVSQPGVAGLCNGLFWLFAVPEADVPLLSIPTILELM